jgi:hypothetical protein
MKPVELYSLIGSSIVVLKKTSILQINRTSKPASMMREKILFLILTILFSIKDLSLFSQPAGQIAGKDSLMLDSLKLRGLIYNGNREAPEIIFTRKKAADFLNEKYKKEEYWSNPDDPLRISIGQLIFHSTNPPYDSTRHDLYIFPFDSILVPWNKFYKWDTLRFKVPVVTPPPFNVYADTLPAIDTGRVVVSRDSISVDTLSLSRGLPVNTGIKPAVIWKDTVILVIADTLDEVKSSGSRFPFRYYSRPFQGDSIMAAVKTLMDYLEARDSSMVYFTGTGKIVIPVWLNSRSDRMVRYWLRNEFNDSVTVWIGNPERNTFGLYLEKGINFRRPMRQGNIADARVDVEKINTTRLQEIQKIVTKQQFWKFRSEMSAILSQASLSNWVKGGESSVSTTLDITGYADYSNPRVKVTSNNYARLKYGLVATQENGLRKNLDLLETNSKLNHKAFGKFDFSGIMLFKTQIARGYNYPNDSVPVSKFLCPGILTIGLGLDYKPNKTTSINFSPLSYKATFVTDTSLIDQTKYGIDPHKKAKHEPGISFVITNEKKLFEKVTLTNRLQLFTNYIDNPLNIDVDWEMIAVANINWFTDVRLNTHLIFDDDTKTVVLGADKKPVLGPDGKARKTARIQFKELLGFTFVFRF